MIPEEEELQIQGEVIGDLTRHTVELEETVERLESELAAIRAEYDALTKQKAEFFAEFERLRKDRDYWHDIAITLGPMLHKTEHDQTPL